MPVFVQLTTADLCRELTAARRSVTFIGPSISDPLAAAVIAKAGELGFDAITVVLDYDENIFRLGYGMAEAVRMLLEAGIPVRKQPGLRISLLLVDEHGWALHQSPMAVEDPNTPMHNAITLLPQQVREINASVILQPNSMLARLRTEHLPTQEHSLTVETVQGRQPEQHPPEIGATQLSRDEEQRVFDTIKTNPPLGFELQRQVNVYKAHLQFVEIELIGGHIESHTLKLPKSLREELFGKDKKLQDRLRASYRLIDSQELAGLSEIREDVKNLRNLSKPLNEQLGRVLLSVHKKAFMKRIEAIEEKIARFRVKGLDALDKEIDKSLAGLAAAFADRVALNPPDDLLFGQSDRISAKDAKAWLVANMKKYAPSANSLMQNIKLYYTFKDVTYEMLKNPDFQQKIAEVYPRESWAKLLEESVAAKSRSGYNTFQPAPNTQDLLDN